MTSASRCTPASQRNAGPSWSGVGSRHHSRVTKEPTFSPGPGQAGPLGHPWSLPPNPISTEKTGQSRPSSTREAKHRPRRRWSHVPPDATLTHAHFTDEDVSCGQTAEEWAIRRESTVGRRPPGNTLGSSYHAPPSWADSPLPTASRAPADRPASPDKAGHDLRQE